MVTSIMCYVNFPKEKTNHGAQLDEQELKQWHSAPLLTKPINPQGDVQSIHEGRIHKDKSYEEGISQMQIA